MNPYSIPSLVSALFMFALGLISLLYGRREKVNIVFAIFCFTLSLAAFASFIFHETDTLEEAVRWTKAPYAFAIPAAMFTVYYALVLTSYINQLDKKLWIISLRAFIISLYASGVVIEILTIFTDLIIAGAEFHEPTGYEHTYGSFFLPTAMGFSALTITVIVILYKAYKQAETKPDRIQLRYNLIGFSSIYVPAGIMIIYLPYFGIQTHSLSMIPFTVAAFIFYLAIVRYQFSQIDELNVGLERKVEERTRELREAQAQLVQSEKMASLGQLVAGVAHDINTPLGSINSNNDILGRSVEKLKNELDKIELNSLDKSPQVTKVIEIIENLSNVNKIAGERITGIVNSLKTFARLDQAKILKTDLHECIDTTLILLNHELKDRINVTKDYGDIPEINCRANDLNQVIMNIFRNAIQAIENKGEIKISTGKNEENVQIKISDSGKGIPPEEIDKIFNPGFTTKGVGVGTGLGLSICHQILEEHKGKIYVESESGKGSSFTIEIPIAGIFV